MKQILIEFDGPTHFMKRVKKNTDDAHVIPNGKYYFKRRILERLGYEVHNIYYQEFDDAYRKGEGEDFVRELANKIEIFS